MLIKWRFVLRVSVSFNMAKSNSKPYYAVRKGRKTGVFTSWDQVQPLVDKFPGAQQKRFESLAQAELWVSTAVCVSPPKSTPPSSAGSNGTQSPRLDRSPRKPTWSSSQSLGLEGVRRDLPSSPTRSKPRMDNYTTKVNNEKMEVATRATNLENPTNLTGKEETTWCPTTSEMEMGWSLFRMIQSDPWNKVEVEGRIESGRTLFEIYFNENNSQNVVRPVVVADCQTEEEQVARAVLVGVYEACKLIHARNDGLKYEIQTTSMFVIECYYRRCFKWQINGWVDTDNTPVPHREVVEPTMELLQQLKGRIRFGKLKVVEQ
ncbi:Caulimovirus viroplasmin-domain-containing protein [Yarrowia lipolytica]|uniref:Ribonuclease H n=1 Tax=Yarrowia lipolytica TaxID=4952 RepID=A0A371CAN2_YARLL|nr:Caulimovirus viroplasmin-domain-containing protein [Yarrowia lipolytica]